MGFCFQWPHEVLQTSIFLFFWKFLIKCQVRLIVLENFPEILFFLWNYYRINIKPGTSMRISPSIALGKSSPRIYSKDSSSKLPSVRTVYFIKWTPCMVFCTSFDKYSTTFWKKKFKNFLKSSSTNHNLYKDFRNLEITKSFKSLTNTNYNSTTVQRFFQDFIQCLIRVLFLWP